MYNSLFQKASYTQYTIAQVKSHLKTDNGHLDCIKWAIFNDSKNNRWE